MSALLSILDAWADQVERPEPNVYTMRAQLNRGEPLRKITMKPTTLDCPGDISRASLKIKPGEDCWIITGDEVRQARVIYFDDEHTKRLLVKYQTHAAWHFTDRPIEAVYETKPEALQVLAARLMKEGVERITKGQALLGRTE